MIEFFKRWYSDHFSDPSVVTLSVLLLFGFFIIYFLGSLIAPLLAAIVLAYLLEWPVAQLSKIKIPREYSVVVVVALFTLLMILAIGGLLPLIITQGTNLIREMPAMLSHLQVLINKLPELYPDIVDVSFVDTFTNQLRSKLLTAGQTVISVSFSSLFNLAIILVYMILVPLLVFFLLKDKKSLIDGVTRFIPKERALATQVWSEMNIQIVNYIRGKVLEILIVGSVSGVSFWLMDLRYAALLGVGVGLSVLVPYVGAALVTLPVVTMALFQWGWSTQTATLLAVYTVIQALDGNVLVPLLFSEAVNLHPVSIIVAVLVFGGLWGFWGVFFAIPLATLVKAVMNVWPHQQSEVQ